MFYIFSSSIFLFGLAVGSFVNCLVWRLHSGQSLFGRSACPACGQKIAWHDNLPLVSFIFLRGRCRRCHGQISWQYPLVEIFFGVLFVFAWLYNLADIFGPAGIVGLMKLTGDPIWLKARDLWLILARDFSFLAALAVIFLYDWRWQLIPDAVALPAAGLVGALNLFLDFHWKNILISGIIGAGFFLVQFLVSRGRWIGGGDIRVGLLLGLGLGWPLILIALLLAYVGGALMAGLLLVSGRKKLGAQLPLAVFLAPAAAFTLFFGSAVAAWYLALIGY